MREFRYYKILRVNNNATQGDIKKAYLRLAKQYHPDINHDPKAQEIFKKINEAYGVISNSDRRIEYDASPAECPLCWTYEVIQSENTNWRCRHCGCKFDLQFAEKVIEQVEKNTISERLQKVIKIFQTTQCSWCKRFYTQPFLCPSSRLQSSCYSFSRMTYEERNRILADEKWWWRMDDLLHQVQSRGIMCKCRECGALNPNPQVNVCWQCKKDTLTCPDCGTILRYNIESEKWKCDLASCGKEFKIFPKKVDSGLEISQEHCPKCKNYLFFDRESLLWKCKVCKGIFTREEYTRYKAEQNRSQPEKSEPKTKSNDDMQTKDTGNSGHSKADKPLKHQKEKEKSTYYLSRRIISFLIVAAIVVILGSACFSWYQAIHKNTPVTQPAQNPVTIITLSGKQWVTTTITPVVSEVVSSTTKIADAPTILVTPTVLSVTVPTNTLQTVTPLSTTTMSKQSISTTSLTTSTAIVPGATSSISRSSFQAIDQYALATPESMTKSIDTLADYLVQQAKNDFEKTRAIYRWITQNISYDFEAYLTKNYGSTKASDVLVSRSSICEGYSSLFYALAKASGLEVVTITGWAKGISYNVGDQITGPTNHAWNAVKISGGWYLIDSTWGAGHIYQQQFVREFEESYFFTDPEKFIYNHLPQDSKWQLLTTPISSSDFTALPYIYTKFMSYGLSLGNNTKAVITANDNLSLTFPVPNNIYLMALLFQGSVELSDSYTSALRSGNQYQIKATFPQSGTYILRIYAREGSAYGNYEGVLEYKVIVN
jgi:transglutaminase-like putative cysteine protease